MHRERRMEKAAYLLPTTGELKRENIFKTLDLCQAYRQLKVSEFTAAVLPINTFSLEKVKHLPFGILASPAIFRHTIKTTLAGIQGISIYL